MINPLSSKDNFLLSELFPFDQARPMQTKVIKTAINAFNDGKKIVILESPVGSGKSAIALTIAKYFKTSHILTPRKSLQDQYYDDFKNHDLVVMKGRSSYPCTYKEPRGAYDKVIEYIDKGSAYIPIRTLRNTAEGPCLKTGKSGTRAKNQCTDNGAKPCPYTVASDVALRHDHVVHNFHSFLFQVNFANKFPKRDLMVIDEAHEIENIIRGFVTKKMKVPGLHSEFTETPPSMGADIDTWYDWFLKDDFLPRDDEEREEYIDKCQRFRNAGIEEYVLEIEEDENRRSTTYIFVPVSIGDKPNQYLFQHADRTLLMSGTIYDEEYYCRQIGVKRSDVHFIKVGSSFPLPNRPIYMKKEYLIDTSHASWYENLPKLGISIMEILNVFKDAKGLIHVPSYRAAEELIKEVNNPRLSSHRKEDFLTTLSSFYESDGNGVLVSPVCQQGVDFKDDRARFQVITRIPYLNTGDPFVHYMVKNNFAWYNYQALITFGQQIGRVNRSEKDFGVTVLMDSRFPTFIKRNRHRLPKWLRDAIIQ